MAAPQPPPTTRADRSAPGSPRGLAPARAARTAAPRWRPTSATASIAARAAASRACPPAGGGSRRGRGRARATPGGRLAACRGDRDRAARRDAADRRADRPRRPQRRAGPGAGRPGRRGAPASRRRRPPPRSRRMRATTPAMRGGRRQRVARGHRRLHDPAHDPAQGGGDRRSRSTSAKQGAVDDGATDAAVLDSDLYSSLPPGKYVIYSGVYTDRKSAEAALKGSARTSRRDRGRGRRRIRRPRTLGGAATDVPTTTEEPAPARPRRCPRSQPCPRRRARRGPGARSSRRPVASRRSPGSGDRSDARPDRAAEAVLQAAAAQAPGRAGAGRPAAGCAAPGRGCPGAPLPGRGGRPQQAQPPQQASRRRRRWPLRSTAPCARVVTSSLGGTLTCSPTSAGSSTRWRSVTTSGSTSSSAARRSCRPSTPS